MEARLLQLCRCVSACRDPLPGRHALWHVMGPHAGGIPLSEPGPSTSASILSLGAQRQAFLLCLLNKGSEWQGWRLHAVGPLEEKPYHTCNIILVQNVEEDSRSESSVGNEEEDLLDVEPPSYAAVNRLGLQQ